MSKFFEGFVGRTRGGLFGKRKPKNGGPDPHDLAHDQGKVDRAIQQTSVEQNDPLTKPLVIASAAAVILLVFGFGVAWSVSNQGTESYF